MENSKKRKKYFNIYKKSLTMFFILFIFVMFILNAFTKPKDFSQQENRKLASKPVFSMDNLLYNKFTSKYEKYIADQFVMRNFFIDLKSKCERFVGKKENNNVFFGDDNYLIDKFTKPNKEDIEERLKAINTFSKENKDLSKYIMLIPNKIEILKDKLPSFAPTVSEADYVNKFYSGLDKTIKKINVFDTLKANKDKYIYYKTDHHWTTEGAYYAYLEFCKNADIKPKKSDEYKIMTVSKDFYGTLQSKAAIKNIDTDSINVYIPKSEEELVVNFMEEKKKTASLYDTNNLNTKDKYSVFLGGNHPIVKINTMSNSTKNLLIIKDSYANCFIPFLTSNYKNIIVVDLRYYAEDVNTLIKDYGITDMLMLYNVNTFFEDSSILNISEYE